ncbi:MAG: biopolymer transporter ExbD [Candidatus Omnitrophica bacterium CG11_big_fil_rev_8_21_14_0_20_63_9]|nr:MAG: biopolymer transporter ExbD [Candidatus Omnitrophica bacterium CG11_big_fil_rev_8_21_14_0_20_63_9]
MVIIKPFVAKRSRVELIPLIDTFFLLLAFFVFSVFSLSMQEGLRVDLPTATTSAPSKEESLTISVAADGAVLVQQEAVPLASLAAALRQHRAGLVRPPLVLINADRAVSHGVVMSVLDAVRQADLTRVSFQTRSDQP